MCDIIVCIVILKMNAEVEECNLSYIIFYVKMLFKECVSVPFIYVTGYVKMSQIVELIIIFHKWPFCQHTSFYRFCIFFYIMKCDLCLAILENMEYQLRFIHY